MMTLFQLQAENKEWADRNFPGYEFYQPILGLMEELGELCHAELKRTQGIRGDAQKHEGAAKDAVGDIVIFLANYCSARGFDMQSIVEETWERVKKRDWQKDPVNGGE